METNNLMTRVRIEKVTLNIGCGKDQSVLEKARKLIVNITGREPVKTVTQKRIATWGLRPGLPIGIKLTVRGKDAYNLLDRLLVARDRNLTSKQFDDYGNISFGLVEYVEIPGVKYDTDIGMMGLQVCVTLEKPGFRVKKRKNNPSKIAKNHLVTKEQAIEFMKEHFNVNVTGETK